MSTREPLPWFQFSIARLASARGFTRIVGDDAALAALMRFVMHSWVHGPVAAAELEDIVGDGAATLARHMLVQTESGWVLPFLEDARTEQESFRASRAAAGRASAAARQQQSTRVQQVSTPVQHVSNTCQPGQDRTEQNREEPEEKNPPTPLKGGTKARKPAEPIESVLQRPEFKPFVENGAFMASLRDWLEHCGTAGAKARRPAGPQAVAILREALREGPQRFCAAVSRTIAANWQGIHYERGESARTQHSAPRGESAVERAIRFDQLTSGNGSV